MFQPVDLPWGVYLSICLLISNLGQYTTAWLTQRYTFIATPLNSVVYMQSRDVSCLQLDGVRIRIQNIGIRFLIK